MYCRKCGKYIDSDETVCTECQGAETFFSAPAPSQPAPEVPMQYAVPQTVHPQKGNTMDGFKPALISTILAVVGVNLLSVLMEILVSIATFYQISDLASSTDMFSITTPEDAYMYTVLFLVLTFVIIGLSIPSIILGAKSVKLFKTRKAEGYKKPIPAFILGLYGMVGAIALAAVSVGMLYVGILLLTL